MTDEFDDEDAPFTLPTFAERLRSFLNTPPPAAANSPILTDNRAPVEGLMQGK